MNTNLKTIAKVAAFAGAFALTGCAFVPMTVHSHYEPPANVAKVPGADKVTVDVIVKNEKKHKDEISVTKDGYGIPMAGVYMKVSKVFAIAIDNALRAKGFNVSQTGYHNVHIVVNSFHIHEKVHVWSVVHTGHGSMLVKVIDKSGNVTYNKVVNIKHIYFRMPQNFSNMNLTSAGRSKSANILLEKMVNKLVNDSSFIDALMTPNN